MPEGKRKRIHFRKLYSFACFQSKFEDSHAQIGQRGYSRVVHCNDPGNPEAVQLNYRGNYVSTTKYTAANFIPKSLFEQFRRVANIYFLVVACVSFSPLAPFSALSILGPLIVVIGATMAKEGVEDWRRRKQVIFEINFTSCAILILNLLDVFRFSILNVDALVIANYSTLKFILVKFELCLW
jgi:phospholipid-translocating ATPase